MNRLAESLARLTADLDELSLRWAVVGGLAVSVWGEPRLTRDIDVAVSVSSDRDAERIIQDLRSRGYRPLELVEHETANRLATARLSTEEPEWIVTALLFASSGIEPEIVADSQLVEVFPSLRARVATRPHLITMKLLARDDRFRPQDFDDLRSLLAGATLEEIDAVRRLLSLIEKRGYARGRNLPAALDVILQELRG